MKEQPKDERLGRPSASGIYRLARCPGSWQAELRCPAENESSDALAGTRLHAHMEHGTTPEDPEEAEAIAWIRETERNIAVPLFGGDCAEVEREVRYQYSDAYGVVYTGKPDAVYMADGVALIIDYKFGRLGAEAADSNLQLAALAVAVAQSHPEVGTVYACLLQPYVSRKTPRVVRYDSDQLEQAEAYMRRVVGAAMQPGAPLKAGSQQCRYCRAKASCPAALAQLSTFSASDLATTWEQLTPAERYDRYMLWKAVQKVGEQLERKIKADLAAGMEIPGLILGNGKKAFTVTDPTAVFRELNRIYPGAVTAEAFTVCCKVGITELDKLVHSARKAEDPRAKVADSKTWLRNTIAPFAETKISEGSIKEGGAA